MRIHRLPLALARLVFVVVIGVLATALGALGALTRTDAGHAVMARLLSDRSGMLIRGSLQVSRLEGNFVRGITIDSLVVRDTTGDVLAILPRVEVEYQLRNFLRGRILIDRLTAHQPRIHLVQHRGGRMNFEEVLKLGEGKPGGPAGPLVELRNVTITDGILTIRTPWSPPGELRTDAQRDSALRAQRHVPGKRIEPGVRNEGLQQVRTVEDLTVRLARLRIATPDRAPLYIVLDSLAASLNDPLVRLADARGELTQARDTLWFNLERAGLPGTRGKGEGLVAWPRDTVLFNFSFDASQVALADLRFVSPEFPDFTGSGRLEAYSFDGTLSEYTITDLVAGDANSRVTGRMVAQTHRRKGLGFRGLDLTLQNLDLDVARPYLDTLPFTGRLSGRLQADGYFEDMRVGLNWSFYDDRIAGHPINRLSLNGRVTLGGPEGMVFHQAQLPSADLDLPTMRLAASAVILEGRARAAGMLDGPWKDLTFLGWMEHRDGELPLSRTAGRVRLNTRDTLVSLDADLDFAPLDFDGIRPSFPTLTTLGSVSGPVRLAGRLDSMEVDARLNGDLGAVHAVGQTTLLPPRWGADSLVLTFEDLDLAKLRGTGPSTRLAGTTMARGVIDSLVAPDGEVRIGLRSGWIEQFQLDSMAAHLAVRDSVLTVDRSTLHWAGGSATADGTLGWVRPHDGEMRIDVSASSLGGLDSTAVTLLGLEPDTAGTREQLDGSLEARTVLRGALDSLDLRTEGRVAALQLAGLHVPAAQGSFRWQGGVRPAMAVSATVDSADVMGLAFGGLAFEAAGPADSLVWATRGRAGRMLQLDGRGAFMRQEGRVLRLDALEAWVRDNRWLLNRPFSASLSDSVFALTPVRFVRTDGGAWIDVEGTIPNRAPGEFDVRLFGIDLRDIYAALQRDTTGVRGSLLMDLRIAGTGDAPTIRGTGSLAGPVIGDFRAPMARMAMYYTDRRLLSGITFWRAGAPIMEVSAGLPLDLAWRGERGGRRQLPGELGIRIRSDSMDLGIMEAFSRNVRRARGTMSADVLIGGSWERPRLDGSVTVRNGGAAVPSLGVSYGPIDGRMTLSGDSLVVDSLHIGGERGSAEVGGMIRLERLTTPILDLRAVARGFAVMNVPDYLTLELDGAMILTGPMLHPELTGRGTVRNSVLYFSDLVSKSIVNLEDPLYADLVDTTALRTRGLGAQFQSRFLDSLAIRNFTLRAAEGVWLRSSEANIQLEGQASVNKVRQIYRLEGAFTALRGAYNLRIGPITRAFDVTRGEVRYLGDPDLNADLDIEARHVIKSASADAAARDLEIIAKIGGTLRVPKLTLESTIRPPLSQSDLVSMLLLGQTVNSQVANTGSNVAGQRAVALLAGTLTSELERALMSGGSEASPDLIEIRPGVAYGAVAAGTSLTRLSAGWQLGTRWFVSLNAGFCPGFQQFDYRNFGASLDYRLSRFSIFQVSADPVQTCLAGAGGGVSTKRYQFGGDLKWTREY